MKLYCVRHGEAVDPVTDPQRPLTPNGREQVALEAKWMAKQGLEVAKIFYSEKLRAFETAKLIADQVVHGEFAEAAFSLDSIESVEQVVAHLSEWEDDVMLVGHMPFVAQLVGQLVANDPDHQIVSFIPGTVVCLEQNARGWRIDWMINPRTLCCCD